ncbi:MAG: hypothetical protein KBF93_27370 [Leptospiraceae bacterium]|nr:hypothetical protein [Leptospiraceae bacterium]
MRTLPYPCVNCIHYDKVEGWYNCQAFPNGIPEKIYINENDHTSPYPGDNGIQYEPIEEKK